MPDLLIKSAENRPLTRERSIDKLVEEALSQIPSAFGRLAYAARSRYDNGRYRHDGLALTHGAEEIHVTLRTAHERAWLAWLNLTLEQQIADVQLYMDGLYLPRVIPAWKQNRPWTAMAPSSAASHERQLFELDFQKVLVLLEATLA